MRSAFVLRDHAGKARLAGGDGGSRILNIPSLTRPKTSPRHRVVQIE